MPRADVFMRAAIKEARAGLLDGGIPIGSVLVIGGKIVGRGRNERVQRNDPTAHAEMACLRNAKRLKPTDYRRAIIYTTLSPCDMCSGAILLYKIPAVVVGENINFRGSESYLKSRGVKLVILNNKGCVRLMAKFISSNPELWNEDIGG